MLHDKSGGKQSTTAGKPAELRGQIMTTEYETAILKLAARVRSANETKWTPTPARKECERVAKALDDVAALLDATSEGMRIEAAHKERGEPEIVTGLDGWSQEEESDLDWPGYESIKWQIRDLAESARMAACALPDPREKHALRHAAMGMLHLRLWHGFPYATAYNDGVAVTELERIAQLAGIVLSREAYRKALKEAMEQFDKNFMPTGFKYLIK